jgi:hypothetical protein
MITHIPYSTSRVAAALAAAFAGLAKNELLRVTGLARLPAETLHVSFLGPSGTQTHTEVGPAPCWPSPGRLRSDERVGEDVDGGQVPGQAGAEVMTGGERVR